jgi:L-2-hydroxyglutarate oxidase LhgO
MDRIDCAVIGAGVIGLAVARELALAGHEVVIIESEQRIGSVTSARNSEVIHAGIYYPQGSDKARLCVAGRHLLYAYCAEHHVPHRRCGKLIVATSPAQVDRLESIRAGAAANGADDLCLLTRAEALALEPALHCVAALLSPSTGIVDSHGFMHALLGDAEGKGAVLALQSKVIGGEVRSDGIRLDVAAAGGEGANVLASIVVNAAGLFAPGVAARIGGLDASHVPRPYFAKGNYYALAGRAPFSHLIYPVPEPGGLGVHLTLDLGGQAKFGPDVEWLSIAAAEEIGYEVDPGRADRFYGEVRKYWPALPDGSLQPAYAGVRPKISPPGTDCDFVIQGPEAHGVPGLINLFGIESPGLTSSLAIAREVRTRLGGQALR